MSSRSTLKNISEKLNLSISTVSRALKDHPDISEATRRKVKELAALMNYEPNTYAVNLRTNSSSVIGLIVPHIANFFYESFITAVEEEARKAGYTLMILQSGNNRQTEIENLKLCRQNRVAGVLLCLAAVTPLSENYKDFFTLHTPVIFFDNIPDDETCNRVCLADSDAARMAAETIISTGRKNVLAVFGNVELSISKLRMDAFLKTFANKAPRISIKVKYADSSDQAGAIVEEAFARKTKPDQLFCMSDEILAGVMKKIYSLHIKVPDNTGILAISNGILPGLFNPSITYIETSGYKLGKLSIRRLFDYLAGDTAHRTIIQPSVLIEGQSI